MIIKCCCFTKWPFDNSSLRALLYHHICYVACSKFEPNQSYLSWLKFENDYWSYWVQISVWSGGDWCNGVLTLKWHCAACPVCNFTLWLGEKSWSLKPPTELIHSPVNSIPWRTKLYHTAPSHRKPNHQTTILLTTTTILLTIPYHTIPYLTI